MAEFTNQATLTFNGITVNSNIVTGQIVSTLTAFKTAVNDSYRMGDTVTYVISLVNTGAVALNGLTVTDNLGGYDFIPQGETQPVILYPLTYVRGSAIYYINGTLQASPNVNVTDTGIVITGINVPAGGSGIIIYRARVNEFAPVLTNDSIINAGTVSGTGIVTPIDFAAAVPTEDEVDLAILKSLSPAEVSENGQITYTFEITNTGNIAADSNAQVRVTDTFNPVLENISVYVDGEILSQSDYFYNEATGEFATNAGVITVPAAAYIQNPVTGEWSVTPGVTTLQVIGNL